MSCRAYQPQEGSVDWKVIEFLTTNPDESLTAEDVSVKFDTPLKGVHTVLGPAVQAAALRRDEDLDSGDLIYRLGAGVPEITPKPAAHPVLEKVGAALTSPLPGRRAKGYVDIAAIQIEKGVPVAPKRLGQSTDWAGLLARMKPGDSCALPLRVRSSVGKIINVEQKAKRGRYCVRKVDAETLRLWRMA